MSTQWILTASALTAASALAGAAGSAPAATQGGASFDCAKAATPVEKAICASPELSRLDRVMAAQYVAAAARTPMPVTLKVQQRDFLAQRIGQDEEGRPAKTVNVANLTELYKIRIEQLTAEIDRARRAASASLPTAALKTRCAVVGVIDCKVEAAGPVPGSNGLFYQLQSPTSDDDWERGTVVLRAEGATLKPLLWNFEGEVPDPPSVVQTPDGQLLVLPSSQGGTGHFNADLVFRPLNGGWRDLDIDAWRTAFNKGLPADLGVSKGVGYDWKALTVQTYLWTGEDANCCPSGGSAEAKLTIQGDRLALKSMTFDRKPPME